jgi:hypothetical protein
MRPNNVGEQLPGELRLAPFLVFEPLLQAATAPAAYPRIAERLFFSGDEPLSLP